MAEPPRYGIGALTKREREVLSRYPETGRNRAIAAAMGLSEQTIKNYINAILRKLGASSMGQAAVMFDRYERGVGPRAFDRRRYDRRSTPDRRAARR